jgi:hypothetical protein
VDLTLSSTDKESSEDIFFILGIRYRTASSPNNGHGENNSGKTLKVIPSAIIGEPPMLVSSRSPKTIANLPKPKESDEAKTI